MKDFKGCYKNQMIKGNWKWSDEAAIFQRL